MHIVLVKPCWQYPIAGADHTYNRRWPPLDLLNTAAILQQDGHRVRIIDAQAQRLSPVEVGRRVGTTDMVLVTSSALDRWQCPTLELAPVVAVIEQLRERARHVLLSGFHGTVHPEAMLEMTGVDAIVRGEPELTVQEVATGRAWQQTAGMTFRHGDQVGSTPDRPPVEMTALPVPAFELIDPRHYQYEILGRRFMVLEGSRGCPFSCNFCSRVIQGRKIRRKTAGQLGREVETAVRQFGVRNIYFIDLEMTASPDLVRGLCKYIVRRKIRVRWCCQTRTDQVDEPLLRQMRQAGCRLIHFGVESASPRIAELSDKRLTVEDHRRALALARLVGMETLCFFLLGYPDETEKEMQQTVRLAKELDPTYASFHRISPYPGTLLYDALPPNTRDLFPVFAGPDEDRRNVDRLVRRALRSYYLRPRYMLSRLLRSSPLSLWRQLRLFAGYFHRAY